MRYWRMFVEVELHCYSRQLGLRLGARAMTTLHVRGRVPSIVMLTASNPMRSKVVSPVVNGAFRVPTRGNYRHGSVVSPAS